MVGLVCPRCGGVLVAAAEVADPPVRCVGCGYACLYASKVPEPKAEVKEK